MKKIYTHSSLDLDAVASVWAIKRFAIPEHSQVVVEFVPANWNGADLRPDDYAVDIEKGIKGEIDGNGRVHSAFKTIMKTYASEEDRLAMANLIEYIDAHDAFGNILEHYAPEMQRNISAILSAASLATTLTAFHAVLGSDHKVLKRMEEVLDGFLKINLARAHLVDYVDKVVWFGKRVALVRAKITGLPSRLFAMGAHFIVYEDGYNIGIIRRQGILEETAPVSVKAIIEKASETGEWYEHPAGFLYCRGSRKAPANSRSGVDPEELAKTLAGGLNGSHRKSKPKEGRSLQGGGQEKRAGTDGQERGDVRGPGPQGNVQTTGPDPDSQHRKETDTAPGKDNPA